MVVLAFVGTCLAEETDGVWPQRILVTNDNGIEDKATLALARSLAKTADVFLVASREDRSGTSNLMSCTRTGEFVVEPREIGEGVRAWSLDGYPADCVIFAVTGPMFDAPPDLVVSGINGGANLADAWFGSGTIGAARTAAYFGIPAIAVSGVEDDDPEAVAAVVDWVVRLVQCGIAQQIRPPSYLTVSLPVVPPSQITGIEVVDRARGIVGGRTRLVLRPGDEGGREFWSFAIENRGRPEAESDVVAVAGNRIAVVPMRVGDADAKTLGWLRENASLLPAWVPKGEEP
jgi:5'-nucleotidase